MSVEEDYRRYGMGTAGDAELFPILVDALLDLPPGREFNKTELAEHAGVTRQTVGNYTDLLLEVELIEEVPNTSPCRYRIADSDVRYFPNESRERCLNATKQSVSV